MQTEEKARHPDDITTIRVRWRTKERIKDLGRMGDSEESIIILCLNIAEPVLRKRREKELLKRRAKEKEEEILRQLEKHERSFREPEEY